MAFSPNMTANTPIETQKRILSIFVLLRTCATEIRPLAADFAALVAAVLAEQVRFIFLVGAKPAKGPTALTAARVFRPQPCRYPHAVIAGRAARVVIQFTLVVDVVRVRDGGDHVGSGAFATVGGEKIHDLGTGYDLILGHKPLE
jgi:hypothetical protein